MDPDGTAVSLSISRKTVAVLGGGISGLCTAYWLKQRGMNVVVLERDSEAGGTMKTIRDQGWMIETGPNSALDTTPLFSQLFTELGILPKRMYANEAAAKRYIVKNGSLHPLPMSAGSFLGTKLWSPAAKLRLLKEPFVGRARKNETISEFVERRLGKEFLDYAINPFVAGVYAGDPATLSVREAFPKLYALEKNYGGLIIGAIRSRRERKKRKEIAKDRAKLFSFDEGMQTFPKALATYLGKSLFLNATVEHVIPMRAGKYPVYTIAYTLDGARETLQADAVVLAAPAHGTATIIRSIDPDMAKTLEAIYYPPVAEVFLGFRKDQIRVQLDGFGFLVPEVEKRNILGSIWSSSLFPERAPRDCVALTSFVGGARNPEFASDDDDKMETLVLDDLRSLMGIEGTPLFRNIMRWQKAIPQYNLGYENVLSAIERFEQNFQRAYICANYRGGIAVGDCVMNAEKVALRILDDLAKM